MPPVTVSSASFASARRASTNTSGVHVQRFPDDEKAGYAVANSDVADRGEKNGASCPAESETCAQSSFMPAVLSRRRAALNPSTVSGKPPKKSTLMFAAVLAPPMCGPNTSRPMRDWRTLAAKLLDDTDVFDGRAASGRSILSTLPRTEATLKSRSSDSLTWYFDPLST